MLTACSWEADRELLMERSVREKSVSGWGRGTLGALTASEPLGSSSTALSHGGHPALGAPQRSTAGLTPAAHPHTCLWHDGDASARSALAHFFQV